MQKVTPENITSLKPNEVFVFGSNLAGAHGGGAARVAMGWGAVWGVAEGFTGQTYALPTLSADYEQLPISQIKGYCNNLYKTIQAFSQYHFLITKVGCGIAGYDVADIAPLFKEFINLKNCSLPQDFIDIIKG